MSLPKTRIGNYEISRLICGGNSFNGFSHISPARDKWLRRYFTPERIAEVMERGLELGVNAVVTSPQPWIKEAQDILEKRVGQRMIYVAITSGDRNPEVQKEKIRTLGDWGAEICLIHGGYTDAHLEIANESIGNMEELLALIREQGMIPGISSHRPEAIVTADKRGYDAEVYIQPLNALGHMSPMEISWVIDTVKNTPKPIVAIKPLACGRLSPPHGLFYTFANIKPKDMVTVGVASVEELEENVQIVSELFESGRVAAEEHKVYTPSKATMGEAAQ